MPASASYIRPTTPQERGKFFPFAVTFGLIADRGSVRSAEMIVVATFATLSLRAERYVCHGACAGRDGRIVETRSRWPGVGRTGHRDFSCASSNRRSRRLAHIPVAP